MKVAGIQLDIAWEAPAANYERAAPWIRAAVGAGARVVLLPEMFACGFSMNTEAIAEPFDGPSIAFLREQAREHRGWVGGSVAERPREGGKPHNTFALAGPGGELHRYSKIHPFTFAAEDQHYRAGTRHVTVEVEGVRLTLFVCYDLRFADEFWVTADDTDAYLVIANWPQRRRHHWTTLLRARAIENQAYCFGLNRVGTGGKLEYAGDSHLYDPWGELLVSAAGRETMVIAELDPAVVADARTKFPVRPDRRELLRR